MAELNPIIAQPDEFDKFAAACLKALETETAALKEIRKITNTSKEAKEKEDYNLLLNEIALHEGAIIKLQSLRAANFYREKKMEEIQIQEKNIQAAAEATKKQYESFDQVAEQNLKTQRLLQEALEKCQELKKQYELRISILEKEIAELNTRIAKNRIEANQMLTSIVGDLAKSNEIKQLNFNGQLVDYREGDYYAHLNKHLKTATADPNFNPKDLPQETLKASVSFAAMLAPPGTSKSAINENGKVLASQSLKAIANHERGGKYLEKLKDISVDEASRDKKTAEKEFCKNESISLDETIKTGEIVTSKVKVEIRNNDKISENVNLEARDFLTFTNENIVERENQLENIKTIIEGINVSSETKDEVSIEKDVAAQGSFDDDFDLDLDDPVPEQAQAVDSTQRMLQGLNIDVANLASPPSYEESQNPNPPAYSPEAEAEQPEPSPPSYEESQEQAAEAEHRFGRGGH
jgi:hypothetical protein